MSKYNPDLTAPTYDINIRASGPDDWLAVIVDYGSGKHQTNVKASSIEELMGKLTVGVCNFQAAIQRLLEQAEMIEKQRDARK